MLCVTVDSRWRSEHVGSKQLVDYHTRKFLAEDYSIKDSPTLKSRIKKRERKLRVE